MGAELAGIEEDVPFNFTGAAELEGDLRAQREQDRRVKAREWKERQDNESLLNKGKDLLFGEDDKPDIPPPDPPARSVVEPSCSSRE